jgi:hypothetical protein
MTRPHFSAWGAQLSVASWNCNPVGSSSFYTTDDPHTHRRFPDNDLEPIFWIHFIKKKKRAISTCALNCWFKKDMMEGYKKKIPTWDVVRILIDGHVCCRSGKIGGWLVLGWDACYPKDVVWCYIL